MYREVLVTTRLGSYLIYSLWYLIQVSDTERTSKYLQLSASGAFIINLDRNRAQFLFLIRCLAEIVARSFFTPFIHLLNYRRSQSSSQEGPTIRTKRLSCKITLDCFNQILQSSVARSKFNRLIQNTTITLECT